MGQNSEYNFSYFSSKPYVVTPNQNRLLKTVQMRGHNICFYAEFYKNFPKLSPNTPSYVELWAFFSDFSHFNEKYYSLGGVENILAQNNL